jgi:uncharacterized protein YjbI with pentapeptide repeats
LLRVELEATFKDSRRFDQADSVHGDRPVNPIWVDRLIPAYPDFEFDRAGRVVSLDIEDLPDVRDLRKADLQEISFEGAYLYPVDFSRSNLTRANLKRAILIDCSFRGADLSRTDLRDAWFENCDLREANFYMARMDRCRSGGGSATRLRLDRAKAKKAEFVGLDLRRAALGAHYDRTVFAGCDLRHTSFEGLDLRYAIFYDNSIGASQVDHFLSAMHIEVDLRS